ncbi:nitrite reductase [Staphylococcus epidermidis]|uniref:nitrite reductase n=1 Tax=Staphylococcus epidermidis TaxID=1282 RepID=UPI0037DA2FD4
MPIFLTHNPHLYPIPNISPHKQPPFSQPTLTPHYLYSPLHHQKIPLKTPQLQQPHTRSLQTYQVEVIDPHIYLSL